MSERSSIVNMVLRRNNVTIAGKGEQAIIFAPGFGCDQNMWRFVAPAFESNYKVILFDYVGSGKSDYEAYSSNKYRELHGYAQDVLEICTTLELNKVIFIGHSVGSVIGMLASIQKPELFQRLIMIGPSPCYLNDPPEYIGGFEKEDLEGLINMMELNYIGWSNYLSNLVMKNPDRPELSAELEESFCTTNPVVAREFAIATFFSDYRSLLPAVKVPSLILQCSDDDVAPIEVEHYIKLNMPNSELRLMKATGHCPHMSHPDETIQLIKEYITTTGKTNNQEVGS